jgi:hypothetical protein
MCNFFSLISNGKGKAYYFNRDLRQQIIDGKLNYVVDSHASIAEFFKPETKLTEDMVNKYEYNPITTKFIIDGLYAKNNDAERIEAFCRQLDFNDVVPNWAYLKDILERLQVYKPINPIIATTMPSKSRIKKIMAQVGDQVRAQVRDQVWAQVGDQVRDQVWAQVWAQVRDQVWAQVGAQVGDQVRAQVGAQVRAQVRDQVRDQVWVIAYYAIKLFMNIPYEHPAFDLIRLGIMVIGVAGKYQVFGEKGKFLGEIDK